MLHHKSMAREANKLQVSLSCHFRIHSAKKKTFSGVMTSSQQATGDAHETCKEKVTQYWSLVCCLKKYFSGMFSKHILS